MKYTRLTPAEVMPRENPAAADESRVWPLAMARIASHPDLTLPEAVVWATEEIAALLARGTFHETERTTRKGLGDHPVKVERVTRYDITFDTGRRIGVKRTPLPDQDV